VNIEELTWDKAREFVLKSDPDLAAIIDDVNPSAKYTFFKARYSYGTKILNQGVLHLPTISGDTLPLNDPKVPNYISKNLGYRVVPLGLILTKSVEVYFETEDRIMPSKLFHNGTMFGLWEAFDPPPTKFVRNVWNLSAGARTVFMLPKISDNVSHTRIKRHYNIEGYAPKSLLEHNKIFIEITHSAKTENKWYCDILFFSKKWVENFEQNVRCLKLHKYWLHKAWRQSFNCRNNMNYDVAWEDFAKALTRKNWMPKPYTINTLKHVLTISEGIYPGFRPAGANEDAMPLRLIQDAYIYHYQLKNYAPIIMYPDHLSDPEIPVYYSLALPTLLEYGVRPRNVPRLMDETRELRMVLKVLMDSLPNNNVSFEFFHYDNDKFGEIIDPAKMPEQDPNLMLFPPEYGERTFANTSRFLKGCIRIALKHPKKIFYS